jgi:photosynthetic reaction center cytochrome c subunit
MGGRRETMVNNRGSIWLILACFLLVMRTVDLTSEEEDEKTDPSFKEEEAIQSLKTAIAGKEKEPAEKVFQNIQVLKGISAASLLGVMKIGYAKSLGVDCTFCHNPIHWELDEKEHKKIAREMILMTRNLNQNILPKIKGLENKEPQVNCTTCHRGQKEPALELK